MIRDDRLVHEWPGDDFSHAAIQTFFPVSVAKSFVSALAGIVIADGSITSIHDPITVDLPELPEHVPKRSTGADFQPEDYCLARGRARLVARATLGDVLWKRVQMRGYLDVRDREEEVIRVAAPQPWDQHLERTF